MLRFNRRKLIIFLIYVSFFFAIPIIKNETRLIEKKIQNHKIEIVFLKRDLSEAHLEFQYLTSPKILEGKVSKNLDIDYSNLDISQIYLNIDDFINEKKKITKVLMNEK
jgi:hypothetical protein